MRGGTVGGCRVGGVIGRSCWELSPLQAFPAFTVGPATDYAGK